MSFKKIGKNLLCVLLERQVKQLRKKNKFTLVAVVGSVGKTSTKAAIAQTLKATSRVQYQLGNYNDRLTVPLIFFGQTEPSIFNIGGWVKLLLANQQLLKRPYPFDTVVVELGIDFPGQMIKFAYLKPDLAVVASVADEHMEYFKTIDIVAREELSVFDFSKQVLVNQDDIASEYLADRSYVSYGTAAADTVLVGHALNGRTTQQITVRLADDSTLAATIRLAGLQGAKAALAAVATGQQLGLSTAAIIKGLEAIQPMAGRMQLLNGIQNSQLIDDTYNASPLAVRAALDYLYQLDTPQRIAILGSMNEMGESSASMHQEIGNYCDPAKLTEVVVIGTQAAEFLAPVARANGCKVTCFLHPAKAGAYVAATIKSGAAVLAKGSQNGVFAEEALVPLLADPNDRKRLVRQSAYWQARKTQSLPPLNSN
jgi:UDP-N-acetylmuramoyl-tripeptide--D-alanyl-D-alanine ligase